MLLGRILASLWLQAEYSTKFALASHAVVFFLKILITKPNKIVIYLQAILVLQIQKVYPFHEEKNFVKFLQMLITLGTVYPFHELNKNLGMCLQM